MEHLFRLLLTRPAVEQDARAPSIRLAQDTPFQAALAQAQQSQDARAAMKAAASQFVASASFVGSPDSLPLAGRLEELSAAFDVLETKKVLNHVDMVKAIEDALDAKLNDIIRNKTLEAPMTALRDSIIAIKLLPEEHRRSIEGLTRRLRDMEVVLITAAVPHFPSSSESLRRVRRRSLKLPSELELRSSLSTLQRQQQLEQERKAREAEQRQQAEAKLQLYTQLKTAIDDLTGLGGDHVQSMTQSPEGGFLLPAAFRPNQASIQSLEQRQRFTDLTVQRAQVIVGRLETVDQLATASLGEAPNTALSASAARVFIAGKGPFTPLAPRASTFRLKSSASDSLSSSTRQLLDQRGLKLAEDPLDFIVSKLEAETTALSKELDVLLGRPVQRTFKRLGRTMLMVSTPAPSVWNNLVVAQFVDAALPLFPPDDRVPSSHGNVAPVGIADLLVVKQQLVRYESADVAHIENVLKGERKQREHTERRETEELTFSESEVTTSEERELESTSRFEMGRETSETIKEDATLKAGLSVSGKYGPTVEFSATAEGSVSRSKEEATKSAAKFSQDVTDRSANKLTQRILERSSRRVTTEVIEKNTHELNNVGGAGNISGVYQWVNKVYQAQMFNYGVRMMYDFMVPEPAAFLIYALRSAHANAVELEKPTPFTLRPDQINESNYFSWVQQYGATDVQPPPEMFKTKSLDFKAGGGDSHTDYNHSGQVAVDEGYKAVFGSVGFAGNIWEDSSSVDVVLGRKTNRFPSGLGIGLWTTALDEETDSVPFVLDTFRHAQIAVAVEVKCQRTDRALLKWRLETHAKLTQAYKARLSEYEEKLAALEVQAGVAIQGRNPALNLELMNDELKKHCITILTEQHFDLFGAISTGGFNIPQIDLFENAAEGPYVRFFEQAFEWEQMTWLTYPYFWGRKSQWNERLSYEDVDPLFNQFLKAGYCRVVVPVRPGFEGAVDHFTTYGEIWNGGPLPAISNPLYLPIADEIAERLDRPGDEIAQGDPWFVRVPTTLVKLRPDDKLPRWQQNANGEWVEA
jgi:hypothetical protein